MTIRAKTNIMNSVRNQVRLIGNLGQDLELKTFESGSKIVKLNIATNEYYTNQKGERVEETQWHSVVAWNKTADLMNNLLKKGDMIAIDGKLVHRTYEDTTGAKRSVSEVVASSFVKLNRTEKEN